MDVNGLFLLRLQHGRQSDGGALAPQLPAAGARAAERPDDEHQPKL